MRHLGPVLPMMILLTVVTAGAIVSRRAPDQTDLNVWVFADGHADIFRDPAGDGGPSLLQLHRQRTGKSVGVELLFWRALEVRLLSMLLSPDSTSTPPDLVAVEIGAVGKFFRARVDDVGFVPLNDYLARSGWKDRILASRFAPYSKNGVIFGIPYDVHPVAIAYRKDLFDAAGIDLAAARTWSEFHDKCLVAQRSWRDRGDRERFAMELTTTQVEWLLCMLMQRGINPVDDRDRVHLSDPRVAETVAFYARLVAGPGKIGEPPPQSGGGYREIAQGRRAAFFCPDWRPMYLKRYTPSLDGRLRLMPMPRFDPGDAPTATWGGTMFGIPRNSRDPEAAWKLIETLLLSNEAMVARRRHTSVLPPVVSDWDDPEYQSPDPFFGGQHVMSMYVDLARQVPVRYATPFTAVAQAELTDVLGKAMRAIEAGRDAELDALCRQWLSESEAELRRRVAFGKLD